MADGHGGTDFFSAYVTKVLRFYLHSFLRSHPPDISQVLAQVIARLQRMVDRAARSKRITHGGSTFTCCVIDNTRSVAFFANLGDSPGFVFSKTDLGYSIKFRTNDHDANSPSEQARILKTNPMVRFVGNYMRLPGGNKLMTVRGFGDYDFGSTIGREPELYTIQLEPGDIVLLSSDGLLEKLNGRNLGPGRDENELCEDIVEAINLDKNLGHYLIQKKITRLAQAFLDSRGTDKSDENIIATSALIETVMDNHMLSIYQVSKTSVPIPTLNKPGLRRCISS